MAIRFGRRSGKYACFSNFFEAPIRCEGMVFGTSEALWQALKTLDKEERLKFTYLNPSEAKRLGRRVKLREDWEDVKYNYMVAVLELKFKQHPDLQEILLSTGDEELIENTTGWHDNIWGDCNCAKCRDIKGRNLLGKALMEVRDYIRNEDGYENLLKAIFEGDEDE